MKLHTTRIIIHRGDGTVEYPTYRLVVDDERGLERVLFDNVVITTADDRFSVEYEGVIK